MENIHGVDVSWLHRSKTDHGHHKSISKDSNKSEVSSTSNELQPPHSNSSAYEPSSTHTNGASSVPATPPAHPPQHSAPRPIPNAHANGSSHEPKTDPSPKKSYSKKWISSLSSKLSQSPKSASSSAEPEVNGKTKSKVTSSPLPQKQSADYFSSNHTSDAEQESKEDHVPELSQSPKASGSLLGALKRISSSQGTFGKAATSSGVVPRQVLNVDKGRERCPVDQLNQARLKRVAFSVDVEIAGHSRYTHDEDNDSSNLKKVGAKSSKDSGEGAALKSNAALQPDKDKDKDLAAAVGGEKLGRTGSGGSMLPWGPEDEFQPPRRGSEEEQRAKDLEEEEKRKRKEEKRRRKEEKQAAAAAAAAAAEAEAAASEPPPEDGTPLAVPPVTDPVETHHKAHDKPTTDPLRMYRRCCQLREAPVLKRISEQLGKLAKKETAASGIVPCLDLRHSRMQLQDIQCVGDWLAIVPVKKLLLEDANLTDEGVRVILAGLLAAKPPGLVKRKRGRSSPTRLRDNSIHRTPGVIEKLTLKNNPKITQEGWKHICVFINMSHSLKAIDVSLIPFPGDAPQAPDKASNCDEVPSKCQPHTLIDLLYMSITERVAGEHLDELLFDECGLNGVQVAKIVDASIKVNLRLLGLASNNLDNQGLEHVARFIRSPNGRGLDIGGTDLRGKMDVIADAMDKNSAIFALSVSNCNLDVSSLAKLFKGLIKLPDFRFLDLSHNHDLFAKQPTALHLLRKFIPQLRFLKRFHLMDVALSPAQAIGVAEILPEARNLAHLSILENPQLTALAGPVGASDQEEACALYAAYMIAVRLSKTLCCVDIDVPSKDSSEIVKALARQIVAYCLRNLDHFAEVDAIVADDAYNALPDISDLDKNVAMPELVTHLLQEIGDDGIAHEVDKSGSDEDYITGGAGVLKALTYLLNASELRRPSTHGTDSPSQKMDAEAEKVQAKEMSKALLGTARQIKAKVGPMREKINESDPDDSVIKRITFFDQTLGNMIERFEREYPETKVPTLDQQQSSALANMESFDFTHSPNRSRESSVSSEQKEYDPSYFTTSDPNNFLSYNFSPEERQATSPLHVQRPSRHNSETSLASRAQAMEEGQMHRLGQRFRREVLPPRGWRDHLHGTHADDEEPEYLRALRSKAEILTGEQIRAKIQEEGLESMLQEFVADKEEFKRMEQENPTEFQNLKDDLVQKAAACNIDDDDEEGKSPPTR